MNRRLAQLFIFLFFAISLAGCVPRIGGGGHTPPKDEFVKGGVAGFPGLPIYPDSKVIESYGASGAYGATLLSGDSLTKVVNWYGPSLGNAGWQYTLSKQSDTNFVYLVKSPKYEGTFIINTAADGKQTAISASVSQR